MAKYIFMKSGADPGFDQGGAPDRERPKTAILGPQFCRILVLGPHFWWSRGGPGPRGPPDPPLEILFVVNILQQNVMLLVTSQRYKDEDTCQNHSL